MTLFLYLKLLLWILFAKLSIFPSVYDHSYKLCSAYRLIQRKMLFGAFKTPTPKAFRGVGLSVVCPSVRPSSLSCRGKNFCPYKLMFQNHFMYVLATFGHFRWPNLVRTLKKYKYTLWHFIIAYKHVSISFRLNVLARTSSYSEQKRCFW